MTTSNQITHPLTIEDIFKIYQTLQQNQVIAKCNYRSYARANYELAKLSKLAETETSQPVSSFLWQTKIPLISDESMPEGFLAIQDNRATVFMNLSTGETLSVDRHDSHFGS